MPISLSRSKVKHMHMQIDNFIVNNPYKCLFNKDSKGAIM